jgi:hypothetical protein
MSNEAMASISAAIHAMPNPFPRVNLIKHYKGATLTQQGRIIAISQDSGMIQATQRLTFPILEGTIHLRSRAFPGAITATVHPIDYTQGTFQLSDLTYRDWIDRGSERVQPKGAVYVDLDHNGRTTRACLDDISAEGMSILVSAMVARNGKLSRGSNVRLSFQLGSKLVFDQVVGEVMYQQKTGSRMLKLGLRLILDDEQKEALEEYILSRYEEILEEVRQNFHRMRDPCRVENLYF